MRFPFQNNYTNNVDFEAPDECNTFTAPNFNFNFSYSLFKLGNSMLSMLYKYTVHLLLIKNY